MDTIREHADLIGFARNFEEYKANRNAGRISAFLTFEDGRMVEGSHESWQLFMTWAIASFPLHGIFRTASATPTLRILRKCKKG